VRKSYHTIEKMGKANARRLAEFLSKNGQFLLPMLDLIEQCRLACDELIDIAGRATVRRCWSSRRNRWREGPRIRADGAAERWSGMASSQAR